MPYIWVTRVYKHHETNRNLYTYPAVFCIWYEQIILIPTLSHHTIFGSIQIIVHFLLCICQDLWSWKTACYICTCLQYRKRLVWLYDWLFYCFQDKLLKNKVCSLYILDSLLPPNCSPYVSRVSSTHLAGRWHTSRGNQDVAKDKKKNSSLCQELNYCHQV